MACRPFAPPPDDARLLSVSPLSDAGSPGRRSPRGTSPPLAASSSAHGVAPAPCGVRVFGFPPAVTGGCFGVLLAPDDAASKHAGEPRRREMCRDPSAVALSWGTVAMIARHTYLFDVVCGVRAGAAFLRPPAPRPGASLETLSPDPLSTAAAASPDITAWEQLMCAVLFRTSLEEAVALRHAVSWEEQCRVEDVLAVLRRCTHAVVDGLLRWVPPSAGVRLLLSRHTSDSDSCWGGVQVGLLDVEHVWRVQRHLLSLRRSWLSSEDEEEYDDVVMGMWASASGVHVDDRPREALYRTVRAFQRQGVHLRRWDADGHGDACAGILRLLRAMAVVAHIESCLESPPPSSDAGAACYRDEADSSRAGGASELPFTPAQREHLAEMLAILLHPCSSDASGEGRRLATHWLWAHLRAEANAELFTGPSRLSFHDFLASLAHWLVLQVVPALMLHVNAASCGDREAAALPPARSLRLRFHCAEESAADSAEVSPASLVAAPVARRNVLLGITMSDWLRSLRHKRAGKNATASGVELAPSLSSTAARLLAVFDTLALFRLAPAAGDGVWPVLSDRVFERHGAWAVAHWVVGRSEAEVAVLRRAYAGGASPAAAPREPVGMFTLGDFIARYRPLVDAARVSSHLPSHPLRQAAAGPQWRPLPPLFRMSLENFDTFAPVIQAKLICSAAAVDYTAHASARDEAEAEEAPAPTAGAWRRASLSRLDADVFGCIPAPLREAPPVVVVVEDSGLVKVHDAGALEQLEAARLRGRAGLHGCGTRLLQVFLRASWSVRWNFVPLRRRAHRRAAVLLQAALRVRAAALAVGRRALQLVELRRRWAEERRGHDVTREQLVRRLEAQAAGGGGGGEDGATQATSPAASWPATPLNALLGAGATRAPAAAPEPLPQGEAWVHAADGRDAAGAVFATEQKGRSVLQHVEAKRRRQIFLALEDKLRERWLLQEYRDRRAIVQQQLQEMQESRVREQRRKCRKQRKQQVKLLQQQREEVQRQSFERRARNEAPRGGVARSPPTVAGDTCSGVHPAADVTSHDDADAGASDVVVVIGIPGDDGDADGQTLTPSRPPSAVRRRPAEGAKTAAPSQGTRVCASLRSLHGGGAPAANSSCRTPRRALWQQEHEDRTFIELSQRHRWQVLRQTCTLAGVALAEMLHRRRIFLAGALEREELLARWRTVLLPYCLITEALHGDFLAALVILQGVPRRHGREAAQRRTSSGLRPLRVNAMPAVVRPRLQQCCRTGGRRYSPPLGGHDENAGNRKRLADATATAAAHREFLCKPNFQLLASHFSNPYASGAGAAVTDRSAPAKGRRPAKAAPAARKRVVTWVDPPPSPPPST
ncbi:uncharacterized protein Tco025E_01934 [Trypanosoma conorhini]|uniref:Uncharacterized protein n=1 Tax=Trypanosoma conorhini TaxID=83891 RepID=A0A422Q7A8_9TRYP|nr:uncharacterized protein Tco025E_01934 [Trypanosoma conorhini]RNF25834.1 hypothetical protein Tco025E_01934 [Trypanosoma conorhini]